MCQLQLQETQGLTDAFDLAAIAGAAAIVGDCVPDGNWVSFVVFHIFECLNFLEILCF